MDRDIQFSQITRDFKDYPCTEDNPGCAEIKSLLKIIAWTEYGEHPVEKERLDRMLQKARDATDKIMLTLHDTLKAMDVHNVHKGSVACELSVRTHGVSQWWVHVERE
jgi:hypothetical protein